MRGTPDNVTQHMKLIGNTPAYAGNTISRSLSTITGREHPRVCEVENPTREETAASITEV